MKVMVRTQYGSWQHVKDSPEGLRFGIYDQNTLEGNQALERCRKEFPTLRFEFEQDAKD